MNGTTLAPCATSAAITSATIVTPPRVTASVLGQRPPGKGNGKKKGKQ